MRIRNGVGARQLAALLGLALALAAGACGGAGTQTRDFDAGAGNANAGRDLKAEPDAEAAVIETDYGRIVIELYPAVAPKHVERFKALAREGFYDGTTVHRAEPEVIQGGDPNSKNDDPRDDGAGGSPYPDLPAEFSAIPYEPGVVGMARMREPNSANCQFFITLARKPEWDNRYTVFGRVVEGLANARIISAAPTRPGTRNPDPKVVIKGVTLQPRANFQ